MPSENAYSQPVTLKNVLKFAVPTIVMTVFMSFYTMIDGLFVSNLLGTDALSAINLSAPIISLVTAVSTMLATGGSAVNRRGSSGLYLSDSGQYRRRYLDVTARLCPDGQNLCRYGSFPKGV